MITEIKISKGIKLPPATQSNGAANRYPFKELNVGDSFFLNKSRNSGGSLVRYWNMSLAPKKFTLRTVTEKNVDGIRIWRIA
jgi:hypothetical protein